MLQNGTTKDSLNLNECLNIFTLRLILDDQDARKVAIVNTVLIPLNNVANLLALFSLSKTKQLKQLRWRVYIRCLLLSNFLLGILVLPLITLLFIVYPKTHSCPIETTTHYLYFLLSYASGFFILAIGIDRLVLQHNLFWYRYALTRRRVIILMFITEAFTLITCTAYIVGTVYGRYLHVKLALSILLFTSTSFIYIKTALAKKKNFVVLFAKPANDIQKQKFESQKLCFIIEFYILGSMVSSLFSVAVEACNLSVIESYRRKDFSQRAYLLYVSILIVTFNSAINGIIFVVRNSLCKGLCLNTFLRGNDLVNEVSNDTNLTHGEEFER